MYAPYPVYSKILFKMYPTLMLILFEKMYLILFSHFKLYLGLDTIQIHLLLMGRYQ